MVDQKIKEQALPGWLGILRLYFASDARSPGAIVEMAKIRMEILTVSRGSDATDFGEAVGVMGRRCAGFHLIQENAQLSGYADFWTVH